MATLTAASHFHFYKITFCLRTDSAQSETKTAMRQNQRLTWDLLHVSSCEPTWSLPDVCGFNSMLNRFWSWRGSSVEQMMLYRCFQWLSAGRGSSARQTELRDSHLLTPEASTSLLSEKSLKNKSTSLKMTLFNVRQLFLQEQSMVIMESSMFIILATFQWFLKLYLILFHFTDWHQSVNTETFHI